MRILGVFISSLLLVILLSFGEQYGSTIISTTDSIASLYKRPLVDWPQPNIDPGVSWKEFSSLPKVDSDYFAIMESPIVVLGKNLFFDPILSGSNQISCSSCHHPQSSWADKVSTPIGHDHQSGTRNTPSLLNVYARKSLFWDGRETALEAQALSPIEAHHEMNMNLTQLIPKLKAIQAYNALFLAAFDDPDYSVPEVLKALSAFQRTLKSRRSRFDEFLDGNYSALSAQQIEGMHLFRTKARCMNCHNGQFLTDEDFHNIGLTYYKRKYEDLGRYYVTGKAEDVGKFRTPSLRDVMNTGPWMHNGMFWNITGVINIYNRGMQMNTATAEQKAADPHHPITDPLMQKLYLSKVEIAAIESFMHAITATSYHMRRPEKLPR
ncbi:cytochrome-c peroxidase [Sphingobacterium sp. lm-10]|uniref:cytochrome-c peroxidase n=1 Tax=Sphingobacterium sp. lm-10 TaxID=2944904 RepID=UPI0020216859|nr:cytochrome c peroxidase [Sphingobacterium sp. lm-10]MCL7986427.1 cytochrome-c peroxidase [Sphingobacterium sp. lm-10]